MIICIRSDDPEDNDDDIDEISRSGVQSLTGDERDSKSKG